MAAGEWPNQPRSPILQSHTFMIGSIGLSQPRPFGQGRQMIAAVSWIDGAIVVLSVIGITAAGSWSAELPRRLLGGPSPVRAFVGHVEPTFNWTLRDPDTGQLLTSSLRSALYGGLYKEHGEPVGQALHRHFSPIGGYWSQWNQSRLRVNRGEDDAYRVARHARLAALDRQSVVILGDPTVTVPQN